MKLKKKEFHKLNQVGSEPLYMQLVSKQNKIFTFSKMEAT